jgi:hypothetical protein
MEQIYLCGPVTGRDRQEAFDHFEIIEKEIKSNERGKELKFFIHNPMKFVTPNLNSWTEEMRMCVATLAVCDGIALLKGWQESRGSRCELNIAHILHIPVVYVEDFDRHIDTD